MSLVTGERVTVPANGLNPTWQRHVAAYKLIADLLNSGRTLDLGCGVGHSFSRLRSPSIGLDLDRAALRGQQRPTVSADMRTLPLRSGSFDAVASVQSIEHVPDAGRVVAEIHRILRPGGSAVIVTPNRLTFGRPDEVIDPYHFIEFSAAELRDLCAGRFEDVRILGIAGSERYLTLVAEEHRRMNRVLSMDVLRVRRAVPRVARQRLYDLALSTARRRRDPRADAIDVGDFRLTEDGVDACLDVVAVCRRQPDSR